MCTNNGLGCSPSVGSIGNLDCVPGIKRHGKAVNIQPQLSTSTADRNNSPIPAQSFRQPCYS